MNPALSFPKVIAGNEPARMGYKQRTLSQMMDTLAPLKPYFEDQAITEIEINGPDDVFIAKHGTEKKVNVNLSAASIRAAITLIATLVEKEVGEHSKQSVLTARLPGFRVEAILPPAAVKGPSMCIRRHAARVFTMEEYIKSGVVPEKYARLFEKAIEDRETMLIAGGTGSGKTTLTNTVLSLIPKEDRLVVIENVAELKITSPNYVSLECDDLHGLTPRDAVKSAMRYKPKRIVLGELRGPEAFDWMDAANSGHPGSLATIHANTANRTLGRLENLLLMANMGIPHEPLRVWVAETVQWVFYIEANGDKRKLSQVTRIHDFNVKTGLYDMESL